MMIMKIKDFSFKSIIFLIQINLIFAVEPHCSELKTCTCFRNTGQIVCEGSSVNDGSLGSVDFGIATGDWKSITIDNTKITNIPASFFKTISSEKIHITNNDDLVSIDKNAFKEIKVGKTSKVYIKNNKKLEGIENLQFLKPFVSSLTHLELDGNRILDLKEGAISGFTKLEEIYLDKQNFEKFPNGTIVSMSIDKKAFSFLNNLQYLDLSNNVFNAIKAEAIDLSSTEVGASGKLIIDITSSKLSNDDLKIPIFKFAEKEFAGKFVVDLQNNSLSKLQDGLLDIIAKKGYVLIGDIETLSCNCKDVPIIQSIMKDKNTVNRIHTLYQHQGCINVDTTPTTLYDCKKN